MEKLILQKIKNRFLSIYFMKKYTQEYEEFQWKNKEEIEDIQVKKLKKVLHNAVENVPYYKKLDLGIDFENFTLPELNKFPIVDKKIIRENFKDFCSAKHNGIISHTSGSTGTPFEFKITKESNFFEDLTKFRAWGMGQNYKYKQKDPIIVLRSYSPKDDEPVFKVSKRENYWYLSPFHINEKNLDLYVDFIRNSHAKILRGYPSAIYIFTLLLKEKNIKLSQIRTLITSSEMLLPMYREVIESYWQIPVLDWYGQNERTVTVQQCWAGNYHNNDDYGIIEVDKQNNIIATSLNNFAMPFIRYNTNDKAIPLSSKIDKCPCGRNLSIPFNGIEGRSDDILIKDDGTMIPSINIYTLMHELHFVKQFQIIQKRNKSITLKIVADMDEEKYKLLSKCVIGRLGNVKLDINVVDFIDRNIQTGKMKIIIREK